MRPAGDANRFISNLRFVRIVCGSRELGNFFARSKPALPMGRAGGFTVRLQKTRAAAHFACRGERCFGSHAGCHFFFVIESPLPAWPRFPLRGSARSVRPRSVPHLWRGAGFSVPGIGYTENMGEFSNPHDRLIRSLFQEAEQAASFFRATLPAGVVQLLNLKQLKILPGTYISEDLRESQSDLLLEIPLRSGESANIYVLFEHKSYVDPGVFVQLLGYLAEIHKRQFADTGRLSVVIPFVFYHGEKSWNLGRCFGDRFSLNAEERRVFAEYIADFQIALFELNDANLDVIIRDAALRAVLGVMKNIREPDFLERLVPLLRGIAESRDPSKKLALLRTLLIYIMNTREQESTEEIKRALIAARIPEQEETMATIADRLREEGKAEGKAEGRTEGEAEGARKAKLETAKAMLAECIPIETVLRVTGLDRETLEGAPPAG